MILPSSLDPAQSPIQYSPLARRQLAGGHTPDSNTGYGCTELGLPTVLVDWLSYTAPAGTDLTDLLPGADRLDWIDLDHGGFGYPNCRRAGHVAVFYGARDEMGIHVSISAQGCRELEAAGLLDPSYIGGWPGLLGWIRANGWKISRLDLALDDRSGLLSIPELADLVRQRAIVTRWRSRSIIESWKPGAVEAGQTIQFGKRASPICLRIYDKAVERGAGRLPAESTGPWVRVEIEAKQELAGQLAAMFEKWAGAAACVAGVLRYYLDFKVPDPADSNKRRWLGDPKWRAFLDHVEKIRLGTDPKPRTLAGVLGWLEAQVAPTLALVVFAAGGDLADLEHLISVGKHRLKPRHLALIPP